jgi:hypothetical protein
MRNNLLSVHGEFSLHSRIERAKISESLHDIGLAHISEHFRRGRVNVIQKQFKGAVFVDKVPRIDNWNVPSFDLGHLFDPNSPYQCDENQLTCIDNEVGRIARVGKITIPFNDCAFIERFSQSKDNSAGVRIIRAKRTGEKVVGEEYLYTYFGGEVGASWIKQPGDFVVSPEGYVEIRVDGEYFRESDKECVDSRIDIISEASASLLRGIVLLSLGETSTMHCEHLARVNKKRSLNKQRPLPPTIKVRLGAVRVQGGESARGSGSSKQPHNRRGHYRKLASGKIVFVSGSRINGGTDKARSYKVVSAPTAELNI